VGEKGGGEEGKEMERRKKRKERSEVRKESGT
jgi:hypothetical protein